jgi:tetratricopeptide (TPR) repeat protein
MTRGKRRRREAGPGADAERGGSTADRRATAIVLLLFVTGFVAAEVYSYTAKSATWDEPIHLTAGYRALAEGDYRTDPSHPPFLRMWAAIPLVFQRPAISDFTLLDRSVENWVRGVAYSYARRFLYEWNDADRLLYQARSMALVWGIALGVLLFAWTREWLGTAAAATALLFYTCSPNLTAHAPLVTTDAGVTCFMFGAVYFLWRASRRATVANVAALAACTALAVVSKFSGLLLLPILAVLLAIAVRWRAIDARTAGRIALVTAASVLFAVWAAYGFRYAAAPDGWTFRLQNTALVQGGLAADVLTWVDDHRLLPNAYSQGLLYTLAALNTQNGYLAGQYSLQGWWYYFPVAFLIKTPIAHLALVALGLVFCVRRRRRLGGLNALFVFVPVAVYMAVAMNAGFNIGLRHILPVYPFVLMIGATAAAALHTSTRRTARAAIVGLAVVAAVEYGSVYPHTLTFFNQFVGGPTNGFRYLADSNLSWGQQLKTLKAWMDDNQVREINLAYFGQADPAYYGMGATVLPGSSALPGMPAPPRLPGYVAVSGTVLSGVYLQPHWRLFYAPLVDRDPDAIVGNAIRVYWLDRWPLVSDAAANPAEIDASRVLGDALLFTLHWPEPAIHYYRRVLAVTPADGVVRANLGAALASAGREDEAMAALREAVEAAPDSARVHTMLARALFARGDAAAGAEHAERAAALGPGDADAQNTLGRVRALQGRFEEARVLFERAVRIDPRHTEARENLDRLTGPADLAAR